MVSPGRRAPRRKLRRFGVFDPAAGQIDSDVGAVEHIVSEIFFDNVAAITEANDELAKAMCPVDHHNVPEDRLAADLHHDLVHLNRLRIRVGFLRRAFEAGYGKVAVLERTLFLDSRISGLLVAQIF